MDNLDELKVKNGYSNQTERISFQVEIHKCSGENSCRDTADITNLLDNVYFTFYNLEENVEFGNPSNIGKRPIRGSDAFHSQFQL